MEFDCGEICSQESSLPVRPSLCSSPEQDNRRLAFSRQRENGAKIRVGRDENAIFFLGASENYVVFSRLQSIVTHVSNVVAKPS